MNKNSLRDWKFTSQTRSERLLLGKTFLACDHAAVLKTAKSKTKFCILPWINMTIDTNGSFRPCCKFVQPNEPGAVVIGNLVDSSLEELWNSSKMRELRRAFIRGEMPGSCVSCWSEEASGIESLREAFVRSKITDQKALDNVDFESEIAGAPLALDLKLSNKCNFKCRICGETASSTFLAENEKQWPGRISEEAKRYLSSNKIFKNEATLDWFQRNVESIQHVELFGGEPMLNDENRMIEKLILDSGRANEVSILYNTNCSIYLPGVVDQFSKFKKVTVGMSVDDIGPRFEYQRTPGKWSVIEKNIARYSESAPENTELILVCSVGVLNVFYLPEYFQWAKTFPRAYAYLNIVHMDAHWNISYLPRELKAKISAKLTAYLPDEANEHSRRQIESVIQFMNVDHFTPEVGETLRAQIRLRDGIRKQDFASTFPAMIELIQA